MLGIFVILLNKKGRLITESPYLPESSEKQPPFANPASPTQIVFDFLFGVVAPIGCLIADPTVFKTSDFSGVRALFPEQAPFAYLFIALCMPVLTYVLLFKTDNLFLAGWLFAGSLFSSLLGILMLPMTLLGLIVFIGIFGFIPFITAFVYYRNVVRILYNTT